MDIISSIDNPQIKVLRSLSEKKFRKFYGEYVVEGIKCVREAIYSGATITKLFVSESKQEEYADIVQNNEGKLVVVSDKLFGRISDTVNPQGIMAQVEMKPSGEFRPTGKPFLVLDRISDPGNMGTIIRTAVATGFNDIVLLDTVEPYNPKTVRATSSGIFHANFYPLSTQNLIDVCKKEGIEVFVADMAGKNIFKTNLPQDNYCLVICNEANGASEEILRGADKIVALPMNSEMESLNAGVCASVMMYEFAKDKF
ncbi:MAG: RNA methyltransferase [Clostridia bacterium]|nr:RNA methyltransferase [Clostridia bacterium]